MSTEKKLATLKMHIQTEYHLIKNFKIVHWMIKIKCMQILMEIISFHIFAGLAEYDIHLFIHERTT